MQKGYLSKSWICYEYVHVGYMVREEKKNKKSWSHGTLIPDDTSNISQLNDLCRCFCCLVQNFLFALCKS